MIRFGICDDEQEQVEKLKTCIQHYYETRGKYCRIETTTNGEDFLEDIYRYDVVFLDIEMSGTEAMQGIKIGAKLRENRNLSVIYITDYEKYMVDAMAAHCFEFRNKPITQEKVDYLLDQVEKYASITEAAIKMKGDLITLKRVIYAKADGRSIVFCFDDGTEKTYTGKFEEVAEKIAQEAEFFAITHRKYIVNLNFIAQKGMELTMTNGDKVPIARTRKDEFNKKYKICIEKTIA